MILGFKEFFDVKKTKPTWFREKILASAGYSWLMESPEKPERIAAKSDYATIYNKPKIHTLRLDPHNRWKPGMSIQMVYRGPKYSIKSHFNKGVQLLDKCISIQKIEIKWMFSKKPALVLQPTGTGPHKMLFVFIDGKEASDDIIKLLVINDGFDNILSFAQYFNKDAVYRCIHWTNFKY